MLQYVKINYSTYNLTSKYPFFLTIGEEQAAMSVSEAIRAAPVGFAHPLISPNTPGSGVNNHCQADQGSDADWHSWHILAVKLLVIRSRSVRLHFAIEQPGGTLN